MGPNMGKFGKMPNMWKSQNYTYLAIIMNTFATTLKKTTHVYIQSDILTIELRKKMVGESDVKVKVINCVISKWLKNGFFTNFIPFFMKGS